MESLNKFFRKGSKNYEAARLLLENKSYDEAMKLIPGIKRKSLYGVRGKLKELKDKGLLGNKKDVTDPPKVLDEASQENRIRIINQLLLKKPNERSREEIEAVAKESGVKPEFLENLIEEKAKMETDKDGVNVTSEEPGSSVDPKGSHRTKSISVNGGKLKIPNSSKPIDPDLPVDPRLETESKGLEGDGEEKLARVIVKVLDKRDQQIKEATEEQLRREEEEDRKAFEIVAKKFNVKPENIPMLLNRQPKGNMLKSVYDLSGVNLSDSQKLSKVMEGLPPEQLRLLLKKSAGTTENPMLIAFKYMDTEVSLVDIMDELNLDFDRAIDLQTKYNRMKKLELERQQLDEPYIKAWFDIAKVLGEDMRRNCPEYHEVDGVCKFWKMEDLSKQYRDTFKGLFRSGKKKEAGYFINVNTHPEICAICSIGTIKMRGEAA